jgi:formyl-CoA transferase
MVEVSLFDALAEWMGAPAYYTSYGGRAPKRTGAHHASIAPYGPFRTRDGAAIFLAIQNAREWARFCTDVLGWPGLADDDRFDTNTRRVENRDALHLAIESTLGTLDASDVEARLDRASIAHARLNSVDDFLAHPQLAARDRWTDVGTPAGLVRTLLPPVQLSGVSPALGPVPSVGQHTEAILEEIGIDRATIGAWRREGAI